MKSSARGSARAGVWAATLAAAILAPACHKSPKVEFKRPPATASVPDLPSPPAMEPEAEAPSAQPPSNPPVEPQPPENRSPRPPPEAPAKPRPTSSPPAAPSPPSPRLAAGEEKTEAGSIGEKVDRADSILLALQDRPLSSEHRDQVEAARDFVAQAKKALADGDLKRAAILADKGLILAGDVERSSRKERSPPR